MPKRLGYGGGRPKDTSKPPVTGKLSIARDVRNVGENTGNTSLERRVQGFPASTLRAAGWVGNPRDKGEKLYRPKKRR